MCVYMLQDAGGGDGGSLKILISSVAFSFKPSILLS